jgi:carboxyl-terminal processing protease
MIRRIPVLLVTLVLAGYGFSGPALADSSEPPQEDDYELYKLLVDTLDQVERNYVKEVSRRELIEAAIRGVLQELDPYSSYISPDQLDDFRSTVQGNFGGIGVKIAVEKGRLQVLSPLVGTPAYEAGILAGDRIVEIDGKSTKGITIQKAVEQLRGESGTEVKLTVLHAGEPEPETITVTRDVIHTETVLGHLRAEGDRWSFLLDPQRQIGYVWITAFSRDTAGDLREALSELAKHDLRGLILDLRFNPGGLLRSAIEVSDLFVAEGEIVKTSGRSGPKRTWEANKEGTFKDFPMVVLVNRYSASASEIVAACLQDHDRAVIIGERTWGKGSVQNVIPLEHDQSALKLTTASYLRPSGKNIHRFPEDDEDDEWGVIPNEGYELKLTDGQMLALVRQRRNRELLRPKKAGAAEPAPSGQPGTPPDESPAEAAPDEPPDSPKPETKPEAENPKRQSGEAKQPPKPSDPPEGAPEGDEESPPDDEESPPGDERPAQPESKAEPKPESKAQAKPEAGPPAGPAAEPVDPQLRMAIDYLSAELARAE